MALWLASSRLRAPQPEKKGEVNELLTLLRSVNGSKEAPATITKKKRETMMTAKKKNERVPGDFLVNDGHIPPPLYPRPVRVAPLERCTR